LTALLLTHDGDELRIDPEQVLTFGRSGDLVVDAANRYLHRVLGCFADRDGVWFLQNMGRHTTIRVIDRTGPDRIEVGPGAQAALTFAEFAVVFDAGPSSYEIRGLHVDG